MRRESLEILDAPGEREALAAQLATMERAHEALLERVRRYERERAEIRARLESILARIASPGSPLP